MTLNNDYMPEDLLVPYGPIDIVDGEITWDDRYGNPPGDLLEFVMECAA